MQQIFKFELGAELKDIVTGIRGIVMVRSHYFTGCRHYALCARKPGKDEDDWDKYRWVDESRLIQVGQGITFEGAKANAKTTSGPMQNPPRLQVG